MEGIVVAALPGLFGIALAIIAVWRIQVEAKLAYERGTRVEKSLEQVHVLVNSNMTSALESEARAVKRELVLMNEVIRINRTIGLEPSKEALAELVATETKIAELDANIRERIKKEEAAKQQ